MPDYASALDNAIHYFWNTRTSHFSKQTKQDGGTRGAVTGGKQLDGFIGLFKAAALDTGIPERYIYTKHNILPGYFRPTKDWDFFIISPQGDLIACIEFKSQVGSYGTTGRRRLLEAQQIYGLRSAKVRLT